MAFVVCWDYLCLRIKETRFVRKEMQERPSSTDTYRLQITWLHLTKDNNEKNAKYNAVSNRNGHKFVAFVVDRFGTVIKNVQNLMFQMFNWNARNNSNEISDAEANIVASRKLKFWLRRIACAMAKTKAMCIINRTNKLIGIQHEKKHGKGSKNSSI